MNRANASISKRELISTNNTHLEELYQLSTVDENSFDIVLDETTNNVELSKNADDINSSWLEKCYVASPISYDKST
jgi:hypothetical protein